MDPTRNYTDDQLHHRRNWSQDDSVSSYSSNESRQGFSAHHYNNSQQTIPPPPKQSSRDLPPYHNPMVKPNKKNDRRRYSIPQDETQVIAIDCEMVGVGEYGLDSSVARVTILDWYDVVLFDQHIKQNQVVTDHRTFVSGVTEENLQSATFSLRDCRKQVLQILYGRILVGHSLKSDLNALGISHPWWLIRDTAQYKPFMKIRYDEQLWPRKLKDLAWENLNQNIQESGKPHSPYEDALAALNLYKTVRSKWEGNFRYKVDKTNRIERENRQARQQMLVQQNHMAQYQYQQMLWQQQYQYVQ